MTTPLTAARRRASRAFRSARCAAVFPWNRGSFWGGACGIGGGGAGRGAVVLLCYISSVKEYSESEWVLTGCSQFYLACCQKNGWDETS